MYLPRTLYFSLSRDDEASGVMVAAAYNDQPGLEKGESGKWGVESVYTYVDI